MIYILKEQVMNGTVTMDTMISGIEAISFSEAIKMLKKCVKIKKIKLSNIEESEDEFTYKIDTGNFPVYGRLDNKTLSMLN